MENKKNKWFNEVCRKEIEKRRVARDNYNRQCEQITRVIYEKEQENCKLNVYYREKRGVS